LSGCVIDTGTRATRHDSVHVERDASEFLRVNLNMGAGNLNVSRGAGGEFLDGTVIYDIDSWKPVVQYSASAGHGVLSVVQPASHQPNIGNLRYEWNLRLANDIPIDISVRFGAGDAKLKLGGLSLRSVEVEMGVGQLDLDLRGAPQRDYDVRIRGGVGEANVRLPRDVGVSAEARGGIGSIHTEGLRREGAHWINDAYDRAKTTIHLDVQGGIGAINLISVLNNAPLRQVRTASLRHPAYILS
jgi:hypothetical protein